MEELETLPQGVSPEPEPAREETVDALAGPQEPEKSEAPAVERADEAPPSAEVPQAEPAAQTERVEVPEDVTGATPPEEPTPERTFSMDEVLTPAESDTEQPASFPVEDTQLRAVLEAIVYIAEEPLTLVQIATALQQPADRVRALLDELVAEFDKPEHGVTIREVAGGFKMATKAEHHEAVRSFVKSLKPPLKLALPSLETLAVIAYKQPVTAPEIQEVRGVRGAGVLNTLLDRKLIAAAGRKNVIGKPILYKTTKEFLIQFGLKDLSELPSLKEFEEIRRLAFADSEISAEEPTPTPAAAAPAEAAAPEPISTAEPSAAVEPSAAAPEAPEASAAPSAASPVPEAPSGESDPTSEPQES